MHQIERQKTLHLNCERSDFVAWLRHGGRRERRAGAMERARRDAGTRAAWALLLTLLLAPGEPHPVHKTDEQAWNESWQRHQALD